MLANISKLIGRRLLSVIPILFAVSALLFMVLRLLPVDPAAMSLPPTATRAEIESMRSAMGLDLPIWHQYAIWLNDAFHGNFGISIHYRSGVGPLVIQTLPATIELSLVAMIVATLIGLFGGLVMFRLRDTTAETVGDIASTVMMSIPDFLWGLFFIFLFGVLWHLLPFTGRLDPDMLQPHTTGFLLIDALIAGKPEVLWSALRHLILPGVALGLAFSPAIMRVLRSSLLDVYQEDYIYQARLRGLSEGRILYKHALKNAILPTLTLMGVQFSFLFGGTLLVEVIYSYPGLGNLMVGAVREADLPVIQTVGLTYCVMTLAINTLVDALCISLNPRLTAQ
jgi:ABC-type dipeptide/oligopeptide/nickel transport system permease component